MEETVLNWGLDNWEQLVAALDRGESLPATFYTDAALTDLEIRRIFRKNWSYVGALEQVPNVGDYITGYVGGVPIVVMRNQHGLTALVNACRHRRHEVMKGSGNAKVMQCGYHAWTYDLTGCLRAAPRSAAEPGFRLEDYPLLPLRLELLGPWIFVSLDAQAQPLHERFGAVLATIARSGVDVDTLALYRHEEWTSNSNWKTMLENYLECYHCAVAHPSFSAAIDVKPDTYHLTWHGWFCTQIGRVRQAALDGKSRVKIYDVRGEVVESQYFLLWPNVTININPGFPNLSIDVWNPDGPNASKGFSQTFFAPGVSATFAQELIAFNAEVGAEDDALTDSVQRGLLGGIPAQGRFMTNAEHLALAFQKLVVTSLADAAPPDWVTTPGESRAVTLEPTPSR
jgi:phenylpropionate dioxygenase-like ring-hydroxylating dioxygenase large terminal subunit